MPHCEVDTRLYFTHHEHAVFYGNNIQLAPRTAEIARHQDPTLGNILLCNECFAAVTAGCT